MTNQPTSGSTGDVFLRNVTPEDLPSFFEHQRDPDAARMAAFPSRDRDAFDAHWAKILADENVIVRTILHGEQVAGNIGSWQSCGRWLICYWIGKEYWNRGIATQALREFIRIVGTRPLFGCVAKGNTASMRVLEKCGFTRCDQHTDPLGVSSDGVEELFWKLTT